MSGWRKSEGRAMMKMTMRVVKKPKAPSAILFLSKIILILSLSIVYSRDRARSPHEDILLTPLAIFCMSLMRDSAVVSSLLHW
jgi:hypothetical protein